MNVKRMLGSAALFAAALIAVSGCGNVKNIETKSSGITYSDGTYPMTCNDTLTVWSTTLGGGEDMNEIPLGREWKKQTGVNVEFIQPMNGSTEAFNVLIASGDLPDIIVANLYNEPGGIMKFANDNIIVPLTDYIDEYAPNLKKYLDEHTDIAKMVKCDNGQYYSFPFAMESEKLTSTAGAVVRKDMLDKAGLQVPETIDEWHTALAAFKAQGATAPLSYDLLFWEERYGVFLGAYGTKADFYIKDGEVKYGYLEPEMREGLSTLNQWYSEGLIDQNIVKIADMDANIMNSATGGSCMWAGGGIGKYMNAMKNKNPDFNLVPAPYPVLNKGEKSQFGSKKFLYDPSGNAFITTNCKNIELAMRFLDYGYTEAGHMLFNFGVEGESYTLEKGEPIYTDKIMHNEDGLSISDAMCKYILANNSGPFIQDVRYIEQYYILDQQKQALDVWSDCDTLSTKLPYLTFTEEESSKVSAIMNDVETCTSEMIFKFIMGLEPLENYDSFVSTLEGFGIRDAINIYNDALERYNAR